MTKLVNNRFVEIGRIGRARGLEGQVRFMPNDNFTVEVFESNPICYMKNDRSDLTPVRIKSLQIEDKKNQQSFFVKFDMIASRERADSSRNKGIYVDKDLIGINLTSEEDDSLFGFRVIFEDKEIGEVLDVLNNPAHQILELKVQSGSLLVPFVDEFVENVDHEKGFITCRNLDQLMDL